MTLFCLELDLCLLIYTSGSIRLILLNNCEIITYYTIIG